MGIIVTVPEELASRLQPIESHLPEILEMGIREWHAQHGAGFTGLADILQTLAGLPKPEDVLALRPAPELQQRLDDLLERTQNGTLSPDERQEWEHYQYVEHLVRLAKANAALKLQGT